MARSISNRPCEHIQCANQRRSGFQLPIPWVRALSYTVLSMVNITCFFLLGGNIGVSNIQWGMRVPLPCCHSFVSACELLVVVVRAPHHKIHIMPVAPMKRMCLGRLVVGLRAAPCEPNFQGDYCLYGVNPVDVCTVVLYANIINGRRSSQLSCSWETNMANMANSVLLNRSTRPSLRGW